MGSRNYSVLVPPVAAEDVLGRVDGMRFVREGFAWLALFFPIIWMIVHRMWLVLVVFIALIGLLTAGVGWLDLDPAVASWGVIGLSFAFALQASDLRRWTLERRGFEVIGAVSGRNREDCERRFFTEWAAEETSPEGEPEPAGA